MIKLENRINSCIIATSTNIEQVGYVVFTNSIKEYDAYSDRVAKRHIQEVKRRRQYDIKPNDTNYFV